jgi:hypothetical protein
VIANHDVDSSSTSFFESKGDTTFKGYKIYSKSIIKDVEYGEPRTNELRIPQRSKIDEKVNNWAST